MGAIVGRSKTGEAINAERRTAAEQRKLVQLRSEAKRAGDLDLWRRAKAVLGYIRGRSVIQMSDELDVTRGAINRWLQWFNAEGVDGLRPRPQTGRPPRLGEAERKALTEIILAGPQAAGFNTGIWTGPMVRQVIEKRFGVRFHNHYVPVLLHKLGFSVQRPRKRLASADAAAQDYWVRVKFPRIKKKRPLAVA